MLLIILIAKWLLLQSDFEDDFKQENFNRVLLRAGATKLWDISPPSRIALINILNSSQVVSIPLIFEWEIKRYICCKLYFVATSTLSCYTCMYM